MKNQAIKKINDEMQKDPTNTFLEIVGHYIIDRCEDAVAAIAVAAEGKTLGGAVKAVMDKARKAAKGNAAVLTPAEVFGEVDSYFGIATDYAAQQQAVGSAQAPAVAVTAPSPAQKKVLDLDFDSFLG